MLISIITSTYNSQDYFPEAVASYKQQQYAYKELIVVDGGSTDHTLSQIKAEPAIDIYISEPDKGIYDALNKGMKLAKGEIIGILHSDDLLYSPDVLEQVSRAFAQNPEVMAVYGDLLYVEREDTGKIIRKWISGACTQKKFALGWMPPHPALFIKKACFEQFGNYDLQYKSAADYDLILRFLYKYQQKAAYVPEVFVKMRVGGISNKTLKNRLRANKEDRLAMKINGVSFPLIKAILKPLRKLRQFVS